MQQFEIGLPEWAYITHGLRQGGRGHAPSVVADIGNSQWLHAESQQGFGRSPVDGDHALQWFGPQWQAATEGQSADGHGLKQLAAFQ